MTDHLALGPEDLIASYYTLARADRFGRARIPFAERVTAAAAAGFAGIGIQPRDHARSLAEGMSLADMLANLDAAGIVMAEMDGAPWWPANGQSESELDAAQGEAIDVAASFGAHHLVAPMPDLDGTVRPEELARRLATIGRRAGEQDLLVGLEFLPWTSVTNLAAAFEIIQMADRPELGLTVDFWHLSVGGDDAATLAGIPGERIMAVHLTDGQRNPSLDPLSETMVGRRLPGDGEFDVVALVRALDASGSVAPIGVEIVSLAHRQLTVESLAVEVYDRVKGVLDEARRPSSAPDVFPRTGNGATALP